MIIRLYEKNCILPNDLCVEDRIDLVDKIIKEYPDNFNMTGNKDIDKKPMTKLDILGTYILQGVKDIRKDKMIMSRYKIRRRPYQERPISSLFENERNSVHEELYSTAYKKI